MKVAIVDYGAGNLTSASKPPYSRSAPTRASLRILSQVAQAERIVVPGVGHFSSTQQLKSSGLGAAVRSAIDRGTPLLGICLGMQWLFDGSEEAAGLGGLAAFPGISRRFPNTIKSLHVGWNQLQHCAPSSRLLQGIPEGSYAYFTHSYRLERAEHTAATSDYAGDFCAAIEPTTFSV